jgi:hypothetical protein
MNPEVAVFTDREIAFAPCRDIVQIAGVADCPALGNIEDLDSVAEFGCQFAVTSTEFRIAGRLPGSWNNRTDAADCMTR